MNVLYCIERGQLRECFLKRGMFEHFEHVTAGGQGMSHVNLREERKSFPGSGKANAKAPRRKCA